MPRKPVGVPMNEPVKGMACLGSRATSNLDQGEMRTALADWRQARPERPVTEGPVSREIKDALRRYRCARLLRTPAFPEAP